MVSLYDYTGGPDKEGRGSKVNAYAKLKNQQMKIRKLDFGNYREVHLYSEEFLDEYFKVEKIFNQ
tara:strand:+ start:666 stop:860 length:195 start_codon:yes stop_codon:yes gene_type:complete